MTPNIDRNLAPETWITAAPLDTITQKDVPGRRLPDDPTVHFIPVRFHMYWAGSDPDGAVVGFYYAVTETTATLDPLTNQVPNLPGPKPRDYHYTTKTDTTFIFNVTEGSPDRQHAFFLYAVDNMGKPDPTPARFMFTAIDKFPPTPVFDIARGLGTVYTYDGGTFAEGKLSGGTFNANSDIRNFTDENIPRTAATDSAAVNARLFFKWHAVLGIAGTFVSKYCYRLEESEFGCVSAQTDSVLYPSGFSAGLKVFTLRTVDQAGGVKDATRRFIMNYMPDTWFSGPDSLDAQFFHNPEREASTGDRRYIDLAGADILNTGWPGVRGTLMSADSFKVLPLLRQQRKTFLEIYNRRLYVHAEGDTVHMNSWVVFYSGGYDKDSKYKVRVDLLDPALPPDLSANPVLVADVENGSPVGFRSQLVIKTDPVGQLSSFAQSTTYPNFQPTSVFRTPRIGGYWPMFFSGKVYALARAEDGDGQLDSKVEDIRGLADRVDAGGGTTPEKVLRRREIMTYYVNKSPFFRTVNTGFSPATDGSTHFTGRLWSINLPATDVDPYDPSETNRPVGIPTPNEVLRYKLSVKGFSFYTGADTTWEYDPGPPSAPYYYNSDTPPSGPFIQIPDKFVRDGDVWVSVELCDCTECERVNGQGRCITRDFQATYSLTAPTVPGASLSPDRGRPR